MDNDTVTRTAATVSKRLNTADGSSPDRGVAATAVLRSPGAAGQMPWQAGRWRANCVPGSSALFGDHAVRSDMGPGANAFRAAGCAGRALVGQGCLRQPEDRN
jgi:hypothetical protein